MLLHYKEIYKLVGILICLTTMSFGQNISCSEHTEYYDNGDIKFCRLVKEDTLSGKILPKGTGVHFSKTGLMDWCFLPENMMIQGHFCGGGGHSFMTGFHPNGELKTAWLVKNEIIQEMPCSKFRFLSAIFHGFHGKSGATTFHDNGQLKYCELSKSIKIQGIQYNKGNAVRFDMEGTLILSEKNEEQIEIY